jgi:hypothetical protein
MRIQTNLGTNAWGVAARLREPATTRARVRPKARRLGLHGLAPTDVFVRSAPPTRPARVRPDATGTSLLGRVRRAIARLFRAA